MCVYIRITVCVCIQGVRYEPGTCSCDILLDWRVRRKRLCRLTGARGTISSRGRKISFFVYTSTHVKYETYRKKVFLFGSLRSQSVEKQSDCCTGFKIENPIDINRCYSIFADFTITPVWDRTPPSVRAGDGARSFFRNTRALYTGGANRRKTKKNRRKKMEKSRTKLGYPRGNVISRAAPCHVHAKY